MKGLPGPDVSGNRYIGEVSNGTDRSDWNPVCGRTTLKAERCHYGESAIQSICLTATSGHRSPVEVEEAHGASLW